MLIICAGVCLSHVRDLVSVVSGLQFVLCAAFTLIYMRASNCFMWGLGEDGRLGTGDESMCLLPVRIQIGECGGGGGGGGGGSGCSGVGEDGDCVEMAAAGSRHTVAVSRRGRVWVWGYGADGQLGLPWVGRRTQKCLLLPSLLDQVST